MFPRWRVKKKFPSRRAEEFFFCSYNAYPLNLHKAVFYFSSSIWQPEHTCKLNTELYTKGIFGNMSNIYNGASWTGSPNSCTNFCDALKIFVPFFILKLNKHCIFFFQSFPFHLHLYFSNKRERLLWWISLLLLFKEMAQKCDKTKTSFVCQ